MFPPQFIIIPVEGSVSYASTLTRSLGRRYGGGLGGVVPIVDKTLAGLGARSVKEA